VSKELKKIYKACTTSKEIDPGRRHTAQRGQRDRKDSSRMQWRKVGKEGVITVEEARAYN